VPGMSEPTFLNVCPQWFLAHEHVLSAWEIWRWWDKGQVSQVCKPMTSWAVSMIEGIQAGVDKAEAERLREQVDESKRRSANRR